MKKPKKMAESRVGKATGVKKFFYLSDVHIPQQHEGLLEHSLNLIEQLKPDQVIVGGDWYDSESVSFHPKNAHLLGDLLDDLAKAQPFEVRLCDLAPEIIFLEGNHEDRLRRYLTHHAPAVARLLPSSNVFFPGASRYISYPGVYQPFPHLSFVHGRYCRSSPLASVKAHYAELGHSVVMGHIHRHATQVITVNGRQHFLIENGHMQDERFVKFHHGPWVMSAGVYVESSPDGSHLFYLDFPVIGGRCRGVRI